MNHTFTRTLTITVTTESHGETLDPNTVEALRDNGFSRLQAAMGQLIDQGMLSGILSFQQSTPAVNLHWSITVDDQPPTNSEA